MVFWRRITFFVGLPAVGLGALNAYLYELEHHKHPRQPFIPYDHLNIDTSPWPWGDGEHSLFHNPVLNPLPTGYEAPDPAEGAHH